MGSSTSEVLLESSGEGPCSPQRKDAVKDSENLACAAAGCGLSDVRSRAEDAHNRSTATRKLGIAVVLCLVFIAVEVTGGLMAHSLAVLTDAAHLLSDVAGFAISLFAIWASSWEATPRQSYGFFRLEILGALLSIQLIWLLTGIIVYEAIYRMIYSSEQVNGRLMFLVATFGFFVNVIMVFLLGHHGHGHNHHGHSHDEDGHSHHGHSHDEDGHSHHGHSHDERGHSRHGQNHAHGHNHHSLLPRIEEHASKQNDEDVHEHSDQVRDHRHHEHNEDERQPLLVTKEPSYAFEETDRRESYKVDIDIKQGDTGETRTTKASSINVKGAWLHVFGDLIQSIGVMIGGAIIWVKPDWTVVDLICTLFFSVIVLGTTIKILRDIMEVLMESTPREIDAKKLEKGLCEIPGVIAIHDLHIWAITMGKTLLACHVTIYSDADADAVLQRVIGYCEEGFNISHVTVQIERQRRRSPFDGSTSS